MSFPPRLGRSEESWSSAPSPNPSTPMVRDSISRRTTNGRKSTMMNPTTDSIDATLFGMPVRTGRWVFVLAGMLMNVCLGTVYAWSVFRAPVAKLFSTADVPITAQANPLAVHAVSGLLHGADADFWTYCAEGASQNGQSCRQPDRCCWLDPVRLRNGNALALPHLRRSRRHGGRYRLRHSDRGRHEVVP